MRKNLAQESGLFTPRLLAAFALCAIGASLAYVSIASTPPSGALTVSNPVVQYDAGPFFQANQSPLGLGQLDSGPRCDAADPCDTYSLTVTLPAGYAAAHPFAGANVTMSWTDTGGGKSDYDLYIYKTGRADCPTTDCSTLDGNERADYQSASGKNPEIASIFPLKDGTQTYTIHIVPNTPTGETVHVKIELLPGSGGPTAGFGGPDATAPGVPRYQIFEAPHGTSAEPSSGEFNIGFNPKTGRIMTMNSGPVWRITPPEVQKPAKPECCDGLWEDKSAASTTIGLDPILFTDQPSGRTFVSNSTAGANAVYAYTDDDGETYVEGGASPPNGGADHQSIGSGPYPAILSALGTAANQGHAVYYCSQDVVGPASCQRSDDLGASYGPGILAYNGQGSGTPGGTDCGGLHGHIRVAPDGTAYLPVNQCAGKQGGALTTDAGTTWQEFIVPGAVSQVNGADPSVAIDSDSTVYYSYVNNEPVAAGSLPEGHAHVKVSKDGGKTWINDFDLGASHGIKNAAEIEAIGGSSGRAAVGFIGTDIAGPYQDLDFPGKWYVFIATTYDGGKTWVTVNATPNDPVQSMTGVWQQGGGAQDRNLLDFNEITVDDKGRVLYGYSDGCVTTGCIAGTKGNDFTAFMRVARQSGGKTIFASNDTAEPAMPKPPCLAGTRDPSTTRLTWKTPDNGGSDIVNYQIFRGTAPGTEVLLGQTGTAKNSFIDSTALSSVPHYFYTVKAINGAGTGLQSNELDLAVVAPPPVENVCSLAGLTELTDPAGDNTPPTPGTDLLSFHLSQPYASDGVIKLVFTINTDPGQSPQPAGSAWYVAMKIPNPAPATTFRYAGVRMDFSGATPTFSSYVPSANTSGSVDGRFVASSKPADPSSNYAAPFDKIVIVVKASDLGLKPGDIVNGFIAGSSQTTNPVGVGVTATALYDMMPDSLAFTGSYTVNSNQTCAPNNAPTSVLSVNPATGTAPLTVQLDGTGSFDPDFSDTISSYTFSFGDGSPDVTQGGPVLSHIYGAAGDYVARLSVTDSRGKVSTNTAQQSIQVAAPGATPTPTPGGSVTPTPTPGGSVTPTPTPGGSITPTPTPGGSATPTPTPAGSATPTPTPGGSATPTPTPNPTPVNLQLLNISGRVFVQSEDKVGIGGFIISGSGTKRVIVRAIGPSLKVGGQPVKGALQDPVLELRDSNGGVISNDSWRSTQEAEIQQTGLAPTDDKEAAIVKRLPPGNYTAIARSADSSPGIGLIEIYDLDSTSTTELGNLSVRADVEKNDNVLIDGLILRGGTPKRILFRGIGPDLTALGVPGALQDPVLELHDANGQLVSQNDNWKDAPNSAEIQSTGLAPGDDHDAAILMTLTPANYTAIVIGANGTTGISLAESFKLN